MDSTASPQKRPRDRPFYDLPDHVVTPHQIIQEARQSLLRPRNTRRPDTPQDGQRNLFGDQSVRDPTQRPPSAISVGSRHFDSESRPVSGTRLTPIDHKLRSTTDGEAPVAPRPPADPNRIVRRTGSSQRQVNHSVSVESHHQGSDTLSKARSGSLQNVAADSSGRAVASAASSTPDSHRRVRSGPKERTSLILDDKGDNDDRGTTQVSDIRRRSKDRGEGARQVESGYGSDSTRNGSSGSRRESSGSSQRDKTLPSSRVEHQRASTKPGSAGRREEESSDDAHFYNTRVEPIVNKMTTYIRGNVAVSGKDDKQPENLLQLSEELYQALEEGNLLGKACKRRSSILKTIFKLLDLDSPKLLLKLARLILAFKVSGSNLNNVCKLIFKVSKEEKNDTLFLDGNILDLLLEAVQTADHVMSADALVYCVGSLKFLSGNGVVVKHLVKRRCIEALAKLLASINKTNAELGKASEQSGHILVQLTATMRNCADVHGTRSHFLSHHVSGELCKVMDNYNNDGDLMMNISRLFSKLTLHADCCSELGQAAHFRSFLHLLHKYQKREDLVVRINFILGNLTAKSDVSRKKLYEQPEAMETLLAVLRLYFELNLKWSLKDEESTEGSKPAGRIEDVLIKTIRVIANLSISEEIGPAIAVNQTLVDLLIQILEHKNLQSSEELVLNTMATINNLSFYNVENSALTGRQLHLAEALLKFLEVKHMEGLAEATRVFGNLSRHKTVRDFLVQNKVDEAMVAMLDSDSREVVFTASGVLINLMADDEKRPVLKTFGGIRKLVDVLRDFSRSDWQLASMVCQTLWNYSGRITSNNDTFGDVEAQELVDLLIEYLDEESALDPALNSSFDEDMQEYIRGIWQSEFCPVATQLLNRLEAHQSDFEPLDYPS